MSQNAIVASEPNGANGYREFELGSFKFSRDEYFVHVRWPAPATGKLTTHVMSADGFLRAMMRDVAWGFFYGQVNFDAVFGTTNLYGQVEVYAGSFNPSYADNNLALTETFDTPIAMATFKAILEDWTNDGFDPFAAPEETGTTWLGKKNGSNLAAIERKRAACKRMPGLKGDAPLRSDANDFPINRAFHDVPQDEPEVIAEPGFEDEVGAFNLFKFLSRSDVTWNPSITSVCRESLFCPTTEEYILPIKHGNDRVEWFVQLSDEITWDIESKDSGMPRAKLIMRPGDVACMPANIRHQGYSRKRSMLLVWENANPELPGLYASGKLPPYPIDF